jgi:DNA sulfur modification protein DndE
MKAPVETVRISQQGRDQLIKLKRATGIEHWNTLCRWALCVSLREPTIPTRSAVAANFEGGVEIPWKTFAGENAEMYAASLYTRALSDSIDASDAASMAGYLRDHIHRGLGYLASGKDTSSIESLFLRWLK